MHSVGIKTLKNKLSEYVRAAAAGETVLVTDRGQVVAELVSPRVRADASPIEQRMGDATRALFENGEVSWKRSKDGVALDTARLQKEQAAVLQGYTVPKPGSRRGFVQT